MGSQTPNSLTFRAFPRGSLKVINLSHFPLRIELENKPFEFKSGEARLIEDPPVGDANASAMVSHTFKDGQWQRIGAGNWPHPGTKRVLQVAFDNAVVSQWPEKPEVTIFRRANGWEPGETHTAGEVTFESIGMTVRVEELYQVS